MATWFRVLIVCSYVSFSKSTLICCSWRATKQQYDGIEIGSQIYEGLWGWSFTSRPTASLAKGSWGEQSTVLSQRLFWSVAVRGIQGQTSAPLPSFLTVGNQPPGVCSNEQAAFSSYILVSPPFENKTLPHLLASGITIIAWRIIGGNSIWGKPCWFETQFQ